MTRTTIIRNTKYKIRTTGSAIILAVVLTSLLAIIGVMFLLSSRVDSIATSAISENKDLNLAVDTIVAQISEELAWDVPRADVNGIPVGEYYDYPDPCNPWLACLEPYQVAAGHYRWRQISNIYGSTSLSIDANILPDYNNTLGLDTAADADGDGVSDSIWVQVPDKTSAKGKPIYAAVRIIDNGGMLNVNTGYKFDPCDPNRIDGSSQTQINLMALSWRPNDPNSPYKPTDAADLLGKRSPVNPYDFSGYERDAIWRYEPPYGPNTPFDISDELEMRYRFLLNHEGIDTRLEDWGGEFRDHRVNPMPYQDIDEWFKTVCIDANLIAPPDLEYAYRHIATTYNLDRIINPAGGKMVNINTDPQDKILVAVKAGLSETIPGDVNALAAQITANLIDYRDDDNEVTVVYSHDDVNDVNISHFGFERPCIYISEIAQNFFQPDVNDPNVESSYAIELHKPYAEDPMPQCPNSSDCSWRLVIDSGRIDLPINWSGSSHFHVFLYDAYSAIKVDFNDINEVNAVPDSNLIIDFNSSSLIELRRRVYDPCYGAIYVTVDSVVVPIADVNTGWLKPKVNNPSDPNLRYITHSFQRDISPNKPIRRLWDLALGQINSPTVGYTNSFPVDANANPEVIQAHPANQQFTNVGELGQLFYAPTYRYGGVGADFSVIVAEPDMRINLAGLAYQQVFKYLTVMDPTLHTGDPNETRIKGRININTAPWYVIAQLPWVSYQSWDLARSIVDYRDAYGAFKSTGELMRVGIANNDVNSIGYYEGRVIPSGLLTPTDGAGDKFEERDAIFDRISNLVTVRSDVFTAYILVRVGSDGPQKRVVAILDRSEVPAKKVKVIAIQPVPDPR